MKHHVVYLLAAACSLTAGLAIAADDNVESARHVLIALHTDEFDLQETDISHLAVGESETIVTDSGQTIDLLRSGDGVEIYVDGELLDPGLGWDAAVNGEHAGTHQRVEVICVDDGSCEKTVWVSDEADADSATLHDLDHEVVMIHGAHGGEESTIELAPGEHEKIIIIREKAWTD